VTALARLLGLPVEASAHAVQIDTIIVLVHVLMGALLVGWGAYFVWVLVRFRSGRNPKANYHPVGGRFSTYSEALIVLAELILLGFFSIPAWATRVGSLPSEDDALVIRVVAEQFAWNVHYPGPDRQFALSDLKRAEADNPLGIVAGSPHSTDDVTTVSELVLPVNRPVIVELTAKDVIHSFGIPAMRVKQDAIPGIMTPVWFTPTRAGVYEVACSQLCGLGHYRMRAVVRVVSSEEFARWLSQSR
jgi:cytochrome c oxidase subunit II